MRRDEHAIAPLVSRFHGETNRTMPGPASLPKRNIWRANLSGMCAHSRCLLVRPPVDARDLAVQAAFPVTVAFTCAIGALLFIGK